MPIEAVYIVHDRQIARHGGAAGLRDSNLLETACARPLNKAEYGEVDVFTLAAAYAFGIAKAHAFVDGNMRTAFVISVTFLRLNGYTFRAEPRKGVAMMEDIATGAVTEVDFAKWLQKGAHAM